MSETTFATALDTLGQLLSADPGRDAIHLATYAVTSEEKVFPGQHVGIVEGSLVSPNVAKLIGIVDPFLAGAVHPGQMFWLVLYPRTITSLRHVWTHPDFGAEDTDAVKLTDDKASSEAWLRAWIKGNDCPDYDTVMSVITTGQLPGQYSGDDEFYFKWEDYGDGPSLFFGGLDAHASIPDEFWDHVEVVTGQKWAPAKRGKHFSCSC